MNTSGDAAEQIVRMSLEGAEVAFKITGAGAKNLAVLIAAILKEEKKAGGETKRLTNMLLSGKEQTVFSLPQKDLKKFATEAKRYGVLYYVVKNKEMNDPNGMVDLIVKAEDAAKINRIIENFKLAMVDKASIVNDIEQKREGKAEKEKEIPEKDAAEIVKEEEAEKPAAKEKKSQENPSAAKTGKGPLSEPDSIRAENHRESSINKQERPSVRAKLNSYKEMEQKQKEESKGKETRTNTHSSNQRRNTNKSKKRKKNRSR